MSRSTWRGAVRCYGRVAPSRPEQRNNVARSSEGQPFTTGMNGWPGLSRLVQVPTWRPGYYIAANADDYFRPSHRRPLLQCCRRLATPSLVAFATDQIYRSLQGAGRKDPLPESLPPKNRACDFHRTRLTHNKSFLHGSRFHHCQTKTMNSLVTGWMKQDAIAKSIGTAIGSMDEMMIVPSSIDVHRVNEHSAQ